MKINYLTLGIKTFLGIAALLLSENVCKPLMLWSRGFRRLRYDPWHEYFRPGERGLGREFAVTRAEKELRHIKQGP